MGVLAIQTQGVFCYLIGALEVELCFYSKKKVNYQISLNITFDELDLYACAWKNKEITFSVFICIILHAIRPTHAIYT